MPWNRGFIRALILTCNIKTASHTNSKSGFRKRLVYIEYAKLDIIVKLGNGTLFIATLAT